MLCPSGDGAVAWDAFGAAVDAAVVVVVAEHPVLWVDWFAASPAVEGFAAVHAALVLAAEPVVCGVVAALLACASCPVSGAYAVGAAWPGWGEAGAVEADAHPVSSQLIAVYSA